MDSPSVRMLAPHAPNLIRSHRPVSDGEPGLPRPKDAWRPLASDPGRCPQLPDELPVPWINDPQDSFGPYRRDCARAHHERLCAVCGTALGACVVLGAKEGERMTSAPGGHPRCMLLAAARCPHLVEREDIVAWEYHGTGVGYDIEATIAMMEVSCTVEEYLQDCLGSGECLAPDVRLLRRDELAALARRDPWGSGPLTERARAAA